MALVFTLSQLKFQQCKGRVISCKPCRRGAVPLADIPPGEQIPLLNDLQCLALHQIQIDLGTQTWTGRRLHHAAGIHFDVVHQSVLERTAARKDFVVVAVRDRHRDVQVGDVVERVTAVVDFALHLEALGHVRDANHRCDTTANGDVAAQHVRRTLIDPLGHAVEAARRELGIDHRDVELLLQLLVVVDVLFGEGVLTLLGLQSFSAINPTAWRIVRINHIFLPVSKYLYPRIPVEPCFVTTNSNKYRSQRSASHLAQKYPLLS